MVSPETSNHHSNPELPLLLWIAPAVFLVLGLGRLPYGYYTFLRLAVCAAGAACAFLMLRAKPSAFTGWLMVFVALLYNPFVPVRLHRLEWQPINIGTVAIFAVVGLAHSGWLQRAVAARRGRASA